MFLSNLHKPFLLAVVCLMLMQGCGSCGSTPTNDNSAITVIPVSKSEFPFTTKEPEVYQGVQVINGNEADRTYIARKGEHWRYDHFRDGSPSITELRTDKWYLLNHSRKIYAEEPPNAGNNLASVGFDYFKGKEHLDFDVVGREGGILKYKVRETKYMMDEILIYVDEASGMIVRQEFAGKGPGEESVQPSFVYEMRNLKLDVEDAVFALPDGYRKVSAKEFRGLSNKR